MPQHRQMFMIVWRYEFLTSIWKCCCLVSVFCQQWV